jgi:hypothetical protein
MSLDIFSFQRAFRARRKMALAASDCSNTLAGAAAKDVLDCIHLGLNCDNADCGEFCDSSSAVNEFIATCQNLLKKLANAECNHITITLPCSNHLSLNEKDGNIQLQMGNKQVTLSNLTIPNLYNNLVQDIQEHPDLYGASLFSYTKNLKQCHTEACALA